MGTCQLKPATELLEFNLHDLMALVRLEIEDLLREGEGSESASDMTDMTLSEYEHPLTSRSSMMPEMLDRVGLVLSSFAA
jgi:hypothetical protein